MMEEKLKVKRIKDKVGEGRDFYLLPFTFYL